MTLQFTFDGTFSSPASEVVANAYYDRESKNLLVLLQSGEFYEYHGVPEPTWQAFNDADSKGGFLNGRIKPWYNVDWHEHVSAVWRGIVKPAEAETAWPDETQHDLEPEEILVPAASAPSAARYVVHYVVDDGFSAKIGGEFESTAHDEAGALVEFNDVVSRLNLNTQIVSVTHYF